MLSDSGDESDVYVVLLMRFINYFFPSKLKSYCGPYIRWTEPRQSVVPIVNMSYSPSPLKVSTLGSSLLSSKDAIGETTRSSLLFHLVRSGSRASQTRSWRFSSSPIPLCALCSTYSSLVLLRTIDNRSSFFFPVPTSTAPEYSPGPFAPSGTWNLWSIRKNKYDQMTVTSMVK